MDSAKTLSAGSAKARHVGTCRFAAAAPSSTSSVLSDLNLKQALYECVLVKAVSFDVLHG